MNRFLIVAILVVSAAALQAGESAFQASLTPDIAVQSKTNEIHGVSLNLWGENPQHGAALGFINGSTGQSSGFSLAFIANYCDSYTGVQWALINYTTKSFTGWQAGWINFDEGAFKGLQSGLVNVSQDTHGLQLGVFNYTDKLHGVQIGFANIVDSNPWFKEFPGKLARGFPIINWSF